MKKHDLTLEMIQQALEMADRTYTRSSCPYAYSSHFLGARPAAIVEELRNLSRWKGLGSVPSLSRDDFANMGFVIRRARLVHVGVRYCIFGGAETDVVVMGKRGKNGERATCPPRAAAWARWQKKIAG